MQNNYLNLNLSQLGFKHCGPFLAAIRRECASDIMTVHDKYGQNIELVPVTSILKMAVEKVRQRKWYLNGTNSHNQVTISSLVNPGFEWEHTLKSQDFEALKEVLKNFQKQALESGLFALNKQGKLVVKFAMQ